MLAVALEYVGHDGINPIICEPGEQSLQRVWREHVVIVQLPQPVSDEGLTSLLRVETMLTEPHVHCTAVPCGFLRAATH